MPRNNPEAYTDPFRQFVAGYTAPQFGAGMGFFGGLGYGLQQIAMPEYQHLNEVNRLRQLMMQYAPQTGAPFSQYHETAGGMG